AIQNYKINISNRERGLKRANSRIESLNMISLTNVFLENKKIEKEHLRKKIENNHENLNTISNNLDINHLNLTMEEIIHFETEFHGANEYLNKLVKKKRTLELEKYLIVLLEEIRDLEKNLKTENELTKLLETKIQGFDKLILE